MATVTEGARNTPAHAPSFSRHNNLCNSAIAGTFPTQSPQSPETEPFSYTLRVGKDMGGRN
jgi:hypothetical protein